MSLGKQIKRARVAIGISQQAIADRFGISRSAVAQWELDRTRPDQDKLVQIAAILHTSVGELLEDSGSYGSHEARQDLQEYRPDRSALLAAWELLLPEERTALLDDIKRRADHNRAAAEAFSAKPAEAPQATTTERQAYVDRRRPGAIYFGYPGPDRRLKKKEGQS